MGKNNYAFLVLLIPLFLLCTSLVLAADDSYKPYLHKAAVPEHPKVKLYGTYQTELFPGAATYTYQLEVPPGTNGLQPYLALTYNSQNMKQRPSILGAGWTLTATYVYRDVNSTPDNVSDDEFRLVLNGAAHTLAYNQSDGFYHTELEAYMKVQNLTTATNTYGTYWLVTTRDGAKYRLGFNTDSELTSNTGKSYALKWGLDEIKDTYGNNVSYTYREDPFSGDNGSAYPDRILYNSEQARKVEFFYETNPRPDRRRVYEQGNRLEESRRLTGINISANGNLVRKYSFEYKILNPENTLTSLSKISFLGTDSVSELHNAQFDYYNSTPGFTNNTAWQIPELFADYVNGDNGDRLADVNNDGFIDIVRSYEQEGIRKVWVNNRRDGWTEQGSTWKIPTWIVNNDRKDTGTMLVDVNGDGLTDFVQGYQLTGYQIKLAYLNNGSGWSNASASAWLPPLMFITNAPSNQEADEGVRFMELNGDGLIDLVQSKKQDTGHATKAVYINNGSGWAKQEDINIGNWTIPALFVGFNNKDNGLRVLDLNADGLDDLLEAQNLSETKSINAWLNNGTGFVNASATWNSPVIFTDLAEPDQGVRFADANVDGLVDIWQGKIGSMITWLNNGSGWNNGSSLDNSSSAWKSPEQFTVNGRNIGRRLADVNGDGLADIMLSFNNASGQRQESWTKNGTIPYLLKSIKTELGANITVSYQNSTQYNNTNLSGVSHIGFNILVVSSVIQNNSLNSSLNAAANYAYNYSGGKYDYKDREFRGFSNVTETLPDGTTIRHSFHQDDILKGKEFKTETYSSSGQLFAAAENTYNYTPSGSSFSVSLTSTATYTHDGTAASPKVTNTTYTYDQYGNVLTKRQLGDTSVAGDEKLERYDYVYNTTAWILDRQSWYRLYSSDNTTKLRDVKYVYDNGIYSSSPSRGDVTSVQSWLDSGQNHQTSLSYDSFGNIVADTDALGRTTKYSYDTLTKTFPTAVINPLGHPTYFSYDLGTGNLLWQKKNDITTNFEYDKFGRIVKEIQPYDTSGTPTKSYNYTFDGTPPESIKVSQKTTTNKTFDTYYFYDGFGQLVQIKTPSYDNKQAVKNFFYDGQGRVKAEQNPYFDTFSSSLSQPSATAAFTNYTYDALSRVTNVTFPDSTNITVVFDHWTASAYDQNSHRKDYHLDAYDRIVKVTEHDYDSILQLNQNYDTTYAYDAADQLIQIIDAKGNNYGFTYDSLGRRIKLNDPDIGEWNYTYDLASNLISQSGGGGNLVTGDGYYREYNTLNQLIRIRNGSSINSPLLEEYTYDPYGERVKIWRNDTAGTVVYTPFRELMQIRNNSGIYDFSYIYDGSTLVARLNPDGSKHYYHPDHLGSTTLVTDAAGNIVEETFYEPYGDVVSGGSSELKLYTGQFSDDLTGQYYYGARYYKPTWGKFIQADSVIQQIYNPQNLNRYSYTWNNPYRYVDYSGNYICDAEGGCYISYLGPFTLTSGPLAYSEDDWEDLLEEGEKGNFAIIPSGRVEARNQEGVTLLTAAGSLATGGLSASTSRISTVGKTQTRVLENAAKGREFETKVLSERGLPKNTQTFKVVDPKTGKIVKTTPDSLGKTGKEVIEIKGSQSVTNTKQLRAEAAVAREMKTTPTLITTANKISAKVKETWNIIKASVTKKKK